MEEDLVEDITDILCDGFYTHLHEAEEVAQEIVDYLIDAGYIKLDY